MSWTPTMTTCAGAALPLAVLPSPAPELERTTAAAALPLEGGNQGNGGESPHGWYPLRPLFSAGPAGDQECKRFRDAVMECDTDTAQHGKPARVRRRGDGYYEIRGDVLLDRGLCAGEAVAQAVQSPLFSRKFDALKHGSRKTGRRALAEAMVEELDRQYAAQSSLGPTTRAYAKAFSRDCRAALAEVRGRFGIKIAVGKAALKGIRERIRTDTVNGWCQSGRRPEEVDDRLAKRYAAVALDPKFQRRLKGRAVPMHSRAWKDTRDLAADLGVRMLSRGWWTEWFDRTYPEFARAYARGKRGFEASALPKIHRDNTLIDPLEWVSLDGHTLNLLCRVPDPHKGWKQGRPVLTGVLDIRTRLLTGWDIRSTENSDAIMAGVKATCRDYGCPQHYYADNGRAYKGSVGARNRRRDPGQSALTSHPFALSAKQLRRIRPQLFDDPRFGNLVAQTGAQRHNTIPYCAWSKIIESWWRIIIDEFERYFPSFFGNVDNRPEDAGKMRTDELPTIDDVVAAFREFLPAFHATERDCLGGLTPTLAYEQFVGEVRRLDPDVLDFLCCRLAGPRTVHADGVTWNNILYGHFDEQVWRLHRRKVWLRIDPEQADSIWLCEESGAPLCRATNKQLTGATQEDVREAARIRSRMRKIAQEYAAVRESLFDTNINEIMRTRRRHAEARQEVARAALPAAMAPATTFIRPDLVAAVKQSNMAPASSRRIHRQDAGATTMPGGAGNPPAESDPDSDASQMALELLLDSRPTSRAEVDEADDAGTALLEFRHAAG